LKYRIAILLFLLLAPSARGGEVPLDARDGDVIFQTSLSSQSLAIQRATRSPYSHVGIIFHRNGKPYVFEAASTVRFTPLRKWIARGSGAHFVIKRLKNADTLLSITAVKNLRKEALRFQGKPYDFTFEWSDRRIYCSELVWKTFDRALGIQVGSPQKLKEFNLSDPIVVRKLEQRYGSNVPLEETVISPGAVFDSMELVTVTEK
jgi:hypothetical protein